MDLQRSDGKLCGGGESEAESVRWSAHMAAGCLKKDGVGSGVLGHHRSRVGDREKETLAAAVQICLGWWRYGYGAAHHGREADAEDPRRCPAGSRLFSCSGSFPISIFSPPSESLIDAIESIDKDMLRCAISRIHPST